MNINIKTQKISLTTAISEYVNKKIGSLSKFLGDQESAAIVHVEIGKTSKHHHAGEDLFSTEVTLAAGSTHLRAEAADADLYASIDKVRDEVLREITSSKNKKISDLKKGGIKAKEMLHTDPDSN